MTLRKVTGSRPVLAKPATFNAFVDAALAHQQRQQNTSVDSLRQSLSSTIILIKNNSGADVPRLGVLGVDGPMIQPATNDLAFKEQVALVCSTPTAGTHEGRFVVLLEPIRNGAVGRAVISGAAITQVTYTTGTETAADIANGQREYLAAGDTGAARILWIDTAGGSSGVATAIVLIGGGGDGGFWAELGAATSIGNNRWSYAFAEARYRQAGTWETLVGGRTGTAYNTLEAGNTSTGVQGNGVNVANLAAGVSIVPIGAGAVVWMRTAINCETGATEYVFEAVNQVDGACA